MGKKIDKSVVLPIIAEIEKKNDEIKSLVEQMPESSMKEAFLNSFNNLDNKCEVYSAPSLSKEERKVARDAAKSALEAFRASKKENEDETTSATADMEGTSTSAGAGKGKGKRH